MKIWCIEDDDGIREIEVYTLQSTGFDAKGFSNGDDFRSALREGTPDLILLDIMLPGENGISILKSLRSEKDDFSIPVIMATAKGQEFDIIQSLDLGADDYLVKPFGMMEMVSRVKAVLRRAKPRISQHALKSGAIFMNIEEHTVSVGEERVNLTLKEFELLRLFLSHPGMVFTREQIMEKIWGEEYYGENRTVDVHIRTLRQKLGASGKQIETVRGVGYRLEVEK